tara:strand:- start:120 stop:275 length:156 start_codon:yes stop_codon:yes gene_type:complete
MEYSIDYKKLYEQVETVNDWLDLLKNRHYKWHKDFKKARGEPDLGDLINIE